MAAYHKVEVSLNTNAVEVGIPSPQTVNVVVPTIGPAGPVGSVGPVGPTGPQGVPGTGLEVLTTQGDLLYQGASTGQRLAIGTSGQVLKVANGIPSWGNESGAVTSVNGETGAVSLSAADVGAAAATHTHDGTDVFLTDDEAYGPVLAQSFAEGRNGIYWPTDLTLNGKPVYKLNRTYGMFFQSLRWHIFENSPLTANIVNSSANDDESFPHQTTWSGGDVQRANVANFGERAAQQFQFVGDVQRVGTSSGLPLKTGSGGEVQAGAFGTGAGQFAEGNHTHTLSAITDAGTAAAVDADQDLNTTSSVTFSGITDSTLADVIGEDLVACNANGQIQRLAGSGIDASLVRSSLGLGTAATNDTGDFAVSGSITTSGLTQSSARLIGRTSSGTGAPEEIQIGSGLSLSAGELSATASGGSKTYAVFTATDNQPPSTAFATLDTRGTGIAVLDFDDTAVKSAVFVGIMPEAASLGSGLIVRLHWMPTTDVTTTRNVRWRVAFERSNTDLDADSFASNTEANGAVPSATSGIPQMTSITVASGDLDGVTAGDLFRVRVTRVGSDSTNDTCAGDAELIAVEVRSAA
jgi:hypothetical protein